MNLALRTGDFTGGLDAELFDLPQWHRVRVSR